MADLLTKYPRQHPETAGRVLDGEAVIVTPADSRMHTLNEVGTWIWERADGTRTVREIAETVLEGFEVDAETAERDTIAFVESLVDAGILELLDAQAEPAPDR